MNRIVNNPDFVVEDMLKGFVKTHKDIVSTTEDARVLKYKNAPVEGKVGIVTGGGSGHKPALSDISEKIFVMPLQSEKSFLHQQQKHF